MYFRPIIAAASIGMRFASIGDSRYHQRHQRAIMPCFIAIAAATGTRYDGMKSSLRIVN